METGGALVLVDDHPQARVLTLNRPEKLNAVSNALNEALIDRLDEARNVPGLRAIVLTGAGRAFCAGGDLELLRRRLAGDADPRSAQLHQELMAGLQALDVPLIAAMNGFSLGIGTEIVAYCDIVIMEEAAWLSEPHASFGLGPLPGVCENWRLVTSRVMLNELVFTARRVQAQEAVELGLANRVVPDGQALASALALAAEIARHPLAGIKASKTALKGSVAR